MKEYYSTTEAAKILGISRVAVLKQIQKKKLYAIRIGKNYAIPGFEITWEGETREVTSAQRVFLDATVKKVISEYGETLRLLQEHSI